MSACVCVRPRGYELYSRDIESVQPAEQVCCVNEAFYARFCNEARHDRNQSNKAMLAP